MQPTTDTATLELDRRSNDGLDVALLWNPQTDRVYVAIHDTRRGESFKFEADPVDALAAFHHPYAYASNPRPASQPARSPQPQGSPG